MTYEDLDNWLRNTTRMQEIYQPAAIRFLLQHGGRATLQQIHEHLEDLRRSRVPQSVRERTIGETREKPCEVLESHGVIEVRDDLWGLRDFSTYTPQQRNDLVSLCTRLVTEWNTSHGYR